MNTLSEFLSQHGIKSLKPELDEKFREIKDDDFKGWYVGSSKKTKKGLPYITFTLGDFKTNERYFFCDQDDTDKDTRKEIQLERARLEKLLYERQAKLEEETAVRAVESLSKMVDVGEKSPYLHKKKIKKHSALCVRNSFGKIDLIIPMKDIHGKIWGYQSIEESGEKQFIRDQKTSGLYYQFGIISPSEPILLAEGFATAASIYEATGRPVLCAFSASNLKTVAEICRANFDKASIVICGDDDSSKKVNAGKIKAIEAARVSQGQAVFPVFKDKDEADSDFNDLQIKEGLGCVAEQINSLNILKPQDIIPTELTGFHSIKFIRGQQVETPEVDDLQKYFLRKTNYVVLDDSKIVLIWNGTHYEQISDQRIAAFAEDNFSPKPINKTVSEFVQKIFRTRLRKTSWFDKTTSKKINFRNGVLHLDDKSFHPHSKDIGFRFVLPYDYDPKADAPQFKKFLNNILPNSVELQKLLMEFSGYCISGDSCWAQKSLILEGEGANGKSTFLAVIRDVIGSDNTTALTLSQLNLETNRQLLDGKLANFAEETPNKKMLDSSTFKNLVTGGDIQVRQLYKNAYFMRNRAKLVFACNELPESFDLTDGFFRRFIIIPFNEKFSHENKNLDPFIENKIKKELPGIFNLCIKAYEEVVDRKAFTDAQEARRALEEYRNQLDPAIEWLQDVLELKPLGNGADETILKISKIYEEYCLFAASSGFKPNTMQGFSKHLRKRIKDYRERFLFKREKHKDSWRTIRGLKATVFHGG